jgi:exosortase/archaeosortase family protein
VVLCLVFLIECDLWIKIVLVASALPIALMTNVTRIVLQCFAYMISEDVAKIFHDWGAIFVVFPMWIGLLYLVYKVLINLVIDDEHRTTMPIQPLGPGGGLGAPRPQSATATAGFGAAPGGAAGTKPGLLSPGIPAARPAIPPVFKR